jgi:predicted metal-dependent hydrolase
MKNINNTVVCVAGVNADIAFKDIKNLHISVYPPLGQVRVAAPLSTPDDVIRRALIQRLPWIRRQRERYASASRQSFREMHSGETHYVWGKRYLLDSSQSSKHYSIDIKGNSLILFSPKGASQSNKLIFLESWYRSALKEAANPLLEKWQSRLHLEVSELNVRKMKTKWGTCSIERNSISLNLELAKKNPRLLEYVLVHELLHLIEPNHGEDFVALLDRHLPDWRLRQNDLNSGPLGYANWRLPQSNK